MAESERTAFHEFADYLALPRLTGLVLSPDGTRLVTTVGAPKTDRTEFGNALWEIDPEGVRPARRLTVSAAGEDSPVFTTDGDLLFVSARPDPADTDETAEEPPAGLWLLPRDGGEARLVGVRAGGLAKPVAAAAARGVAALAKTLPGAVSGEDDRKRRDARREKKVTAMLHAAYPIRFWDHDLGPAQPRVLIGDLPENTPPDDGQVDWRDLTPAPGNALWDTALEISPDGRHVVATWQVAEPYAASRSSLVVFDVTSGRRRMLLDDPRYEFGEPRVSPDGRTVAATRTTRLTPDRAPHTDLVLVPLAGGPARPVAEGWDRWPTQPRWTPDSRALIVVADEHGRAPLFRIDIEDDPERHQTAEATEAEAAVPGVVTRLTGDHGAYRDQTVSPDGSTVYALRDAVDSPPTPVRLDSRRPGQRPEPLRGPAERPALPGSLTEVRATGEDGSPLRGWLVLPTSVDTTPAPLLVWVHGGPLNSWNGWHWRWNPWLLAARGYAVLLPDPALSTGYGWAFVQRGWPNWGDAPYTDVLALADAAEARPDVDGGRTALMGGSFGGYLANWVAGHTNRFAAIVTHASLWALDQFGATTDLAYYPRAELTEEVASRNSPHRHVAEITTPMLVIHGGRDYRVPIGEALRLWWELLAQRPDPEDQPHRFLYFPDENHWVLKPVHAQLWYETVIAFLDHHLRKQPFVVPDLLI